MSAVPVMLPEYAPRSFRAVANVNVALPGEGTNVLLSMARPLLLEVVQLRQSDAPVPIEELRHRLSGMVSTFHREAERHGIDKETVASASYCLCTFLDETVAAMPWGSDGAWANRSLLVTFYGEASGGEHFFSMLASLSKRPAEHVDALELIAVLLALGMQGRYRLVEDGQTALDDVRRKLHQLIRETRNRPLQALSAPWRVEAQRRRIRVAPWLAAGLLGALVIFYGVLQYRLGLTADQTLERLAVLPSARVIPPASTPSLPPWELQLNSQLAGDVADGILDLDTLTDRAAITLHSDALFASGSAAVLPAHQSLVARLGQVLRDVPGRIVVIGYTDNQPPMPGGTSNWQLSVTRANSIAALLRTDEDAPDRYLIQGRGDTDPIASNDTAEGRARNRRVTITLLAPGATL